MDSKITKKQAFAYEVKSSWWAPWVSWEWLQDLAARWFLWKVSRKWRRYKYVERLEEKMGEGNG